MPVAQVTNAPSREDYETVAKILDLDGNPPAGLIAHAASVLPSGEVQIVDVYESAAQLTEFAEQRLFPAFAEAGMLDTIMAGPRPQAHETFHVVRPSH